MDVKIIIKRIIRIFRIKGSSGMVTAQISLLPPTELLKGRTALITGGSSGIGYAIADAYLKAGATVIITGRSQYRLDEACQKLCYGGKYKDRVFGIVMDVSDSSCLEKSFDEACKVSDGSIDILVNNAGIIGGGFNSTSSEEFDNVINTNLKGTFFLSRIVADYMKKNLIKGNILNIASSSSFRPANSAYGLSKWGVRALTEGLARGLAPHGIVVNGIAPGPTATPMLLQGDTDNIFKDNSLIGRYILPEEIANMAVILVSDMSRSIVGDIVCMTGGAGNITNEDLNFNL